MSRCYPFSGHAVYFPDLFPTQIRSTGAAFCNGAARIITSFGPLIAGLLAAALGGFSVAGRSWSASRC